MQWLGVDVGGTFTDFVLYDWETRKIRIQKLPSSLNNQAEAILAGLHKLTAANRLERIVHGTTVATNTALELNGARMAVLVTRGHRDVLVVGRGNRLATYDIKAPAIKPMVPRSQCYEITERLLADGSVLQALDEKEVISIADKLQDEGVEAVAVCFLHSYLNPAHERRCAQLLRERLPNVVVAASSEVLPEYREYERFATTALNVYVAPRMNRYISDLESKLKAEGLSHPLSIMTSNGGSLPADRVKALPVLTMLSGPAAGVIAACQIGRASGYPDLITFDMGGTSTDVCSVHDAAYAMTTDGHVGTLPVKIRQIDIHTVAVGGGSIAASDQGFLTVGPRSAGSVPGPVCYGKGGTQPTITDANVVLGRFDVGRQLGGEIRLDRDASIRAIASLAERVGIDTMEMAEGILRLATVSLASAIKEVSIMRGQDPRDFALLPYGGAGPLHAADVAEHLGMKTVLIPPMPGNFSALGLLLADVRRDFVRTQVSLCSDLSIDEVREVFHALVAQGDTELRAAGFKPENCGYEATLDVRYSGQSFELSVPYGAEMSDIGRIEDAFGEIYAARYGAKTEASVEIVSYRMAAWGSHEKIDLQQLHVTTGDRVDVPTRCVQAVFGGRTFEVPVLQRSQISTSDVISGPALIEEDGTTTVVPPTWAAKLGEAGCLVLLRRYA